MYNLSVAGRCVQLPGEAHRLGLLRLPLLCVGTELTGLLSHGHTFRFMSVLISLIFSVLSTIEEYESFANSVLYWMVKYRFKDQKRNIRKYSIIQESCVQF